MKQNIKKNVIKKNRWLIALSAIGIHLAVGSIYAFSVMIIPLSQTFSSSTSDIKMGFKLSLLVIGLLMAFLGTYSEKVGPKVCGLSATFFFGIAIIGSGIACQLQSLTLFYLFFGLFGGIGLGLGYIAPISTLVKWFPDRRGLATGLAIMGFGFSSLIFGPLMQYLFDTIGAPNTFYVLGFIYIMLMTLSSFYIAPPPPHFYLDINTNDASNHTTDNKSSSNSRIKRRFPNNLTAREALNTSSFYFIYIMIFINVACGLAIIASASPLMQEVLHYSPMQAAAAVGLIGIFNGLGRFFWSSLSDYLGRINVYIIFFSFQLIAFFTLASINKEWLFLFMIFTVVTIYGGGFACLPAFLSDLFGIKQLGAIHGLVLTAWGFAGFFGPSIYDLIKDYSGSLENTLQSFCILLGLALLAAIALKTSMHQKSKHDQSLEKALN